MNYTKNNFDKFDRPINAQLAYVISIFKVIGALSCETINILVLIQSSTIGDVVKDYIAFEIIANVDNIIGELLGNVSEIVEEKVTFELN